MSFLALLPWIALFQGGAPPEAIWLMALLVGLLGVSVWRTPERKIPSVLFWSCSGFLLWTVLSWLTSSTQSWGFQEVLQEGVLILLFLMVAGRSTEEDRRLFLQSFVWTALVCCAVGIVLYIAQPEDRLAGTFMDMNRFGEAWPNALGSLLLLAWPAAALTYKDRPWVRSMLIGFFLGCLALTASRGALLAFGLQCLIGSVLGLWSPHTLTEWRRRFRGLITGTIVILFVIIVSNGLRARNFPVASLAERATFSSSDGASSLTERVHYWAQALALTFERPLTGFGPDSFGAAHEKLQTIAAETSAHPHSILLKLSAERGIPALLFFVVIMVFVLHAGLCSKKKSLKHLLIGIALAGALAQNVIDATLIYLGVALPFWVMCGMLFTEGDRTIALDQRRSLVTLLSGLLIFLSLVELAGPYVMTGEAELQHISDTLGGDALNQADQELSIFQSHNPAEGRGSFLSAQLFVQRSDLPKAKNAYFESLQQWGWNSPLTVASYMGLALLTKDHDALTEHAELLQNMVNSFADAIITNRHGVALGTFPDEFSVLIPQFVTAYPENKTHWLTLGDHVEKAAVNWQRYFKERPQGKIWLRPHPSPATAGLPPLLLHSHL